MDKEQAAELLKKAYEELKATNELAACTLLEQALELDYRNEEIKYALKCVYWWLERIRRIDEYKNPYKKGSILISQLKHYYSFIEQLETVFEQCQYAVRYYVFSKALISFEGLLINQSNQTDHGLLLLAARCYKGIGNYEDALKYIQQAISIKKDDPEILAEAADINALLSETKIAKGLFKEAFFLDPLKIDLRFMESALILKLYEKVIQLGYKGDALNEWIPVYGYLWGVFSIKRELKQMEAGRLKQSIFSLETEYEANPSKRQKIKPRLLNHYFWLIDHYEISREEPSLVEETLLKIKVTDPDIYTMYTGQMSA